MDKILMQQIVDEDVNYYLDVDNKTSVYVEFEDSFITPFCGLVTQ